MNKIKSFICFKIRPELDLHICASTTTEASEATIMLTHPSELQSEWEHWFHSTKDMFLQTGHGLSCPQVTLQQHGRTNPQQCWSLTGLTATWHGQNMLHLCAAHTAGNLQFDREGCFPQTTPTNPYTHSLPMSAAWEGEGLKCRNNLCNIPKAAPSDLADWQKRLILKCKALLWVGRVGGWGGVVKADENPALATAGCDGTRTENVSHLP